jgi:hypothetical protein
MLLTLLQSAGGGPAARLYVRIIRGNDLLGMDDWTVSYFI